MQGELGEEAKQEAEEERAALRLRMQALRRERGGALSREGWGSDLYW